MIIFSGLCGFARDISLSESGFSGLKDYRDFFKYSVGIRYCAFHFIIIN